MRLPLAVFLLLVLPAAALADAPPPQPTLALPTDQVWTLIAGALAPIAAYMLNFRAPWLTEPVKALVQVVVAAVAGGIMQAVTAGGVGFNGRTLQFILTAVFGALAAHSGLWKPSGIQRTLGGGQNKQGPVVPAAPV